METVEFFSKLASRIGYRAISDRSGVSSPTVSKLLSYKKYEGKNRQSATPLVLDALVELATERAEQLRSQAEEIDAHLPGLLKWKEELEQL